MDAELALGFLTGLFGEMDLALSSSDTSVRCQLYVPDRTSKPISTDILLSEDEAKDIQESWGEELGEYDTRRSSTWGWPTLIPLWHLRDAFIATRLLPAIAAKLANNIASSSPPTVAAARAQLVHLFPKRLRG